MADDPQKVLQIFAPYIWTNNLRIEREGWYMQPPYISAMEACRASAEPASLQSPSIVSW